MRAPCNMDERTSEQYPIMTLPREKLSSNEQPSYLAYFYMHTYAAVVKGRGLLRSTLLSN